MKSLFFDYLADVVLAVLRFIYRILERFVAGIQTSIEDCHDHALAGIAAPLRNVAANGRHAVHQLDLVHWFDQLIHLRHICILDAGHILNSFQIFVSGINRQSVEYGRILVANLCIV